MLIMSWIDLFRHKKTYEGTVVDLRERYRVSADTAYDGIATVYYDILRHDDKEKVGTTDLRLSIAGDMYYYGNIGYNILKDQRGHHYAYEACLLLFEIAYREFAMKELIITCSPENIASYKTLRKLNGELIELVKVPRDHPLFAIGEKSKYIFRYRIDLDDRKRDR